MVAQNNQHRLMKNWAAILSISSVLIIRVRYLRLTEGFFFCTPLPQEIPVYFHTLLLKI